MEFSISLWNILGFLGVLGFLVAFFSVTAMLKYRQDAKEWARSQGLIAADIQLRLRELFDEGEITDRGGDEAGQLLRYVQAYIWIDILARYFKIGQRSSPLNDYVDKINAITKRLALWQRVARRVKELHEELSKRGVTTEEEKGELKQLNWMLREIRHGEV